MDKNKNLTIIGLLVLVLVLGALLFKDRLFKHDDRGNVDVVDEDTRNTEKTDDKEDETNQDENTDENTDQNTDEKSALEVATSYAKDELNMDLDNTKFISLEEKAEFAKFKLVDKMGKDVYMLFMDKKDGVWTIRESKKLN